MRAAGHIQITISTECNFNLAGYATRLANRVGCKRKRNSLRQVTFSLALIIMTIIFLNYPHPILPIPQTLQGWRIVFQGCGGIQFHQRCITRLPGGHERRNRVKMPKYTPYSICHVLHTHTLWWTQIIYILHLPLPYLWDKHLRKTETIIVFLLVVDIVANLSVWTESSAQRPAPKTSNRVGVPK